MTEKHDPAIKAQINQLLKEIGSIDIGHGDGTFSSVCSNYGVSMDELESLMQLTKPLSSNEYHQVFLFMVRAKQSTSLTPCIPPSHVLELRARLLMEEVQETIKALGQTGGEPDIVEIIDGCVDIIYVALGTLASCGIPDKIFLKEVCENNLTKVVPTCTLVDGKVQKPEGYKPPRIAEKLLKVLNGIKLVKQAAKLIE